MPNQTHLSYVSWTKNRVKNNKYAKNVKNANKKKMNKNKKKKNLNMKPTMITKEKREFLIVN